MLSASQNCGGEVLPWVKHCSRIRTLKRCVGEKRDWQCPLPRIIVSRAYISKRFPIHAWYISSNRFQTAISQCIHYTFHSPHWSFDILRCHVNLLQIGKTHPFDWYCIWIVAIDRSYHENPQPKKTQGQEPDIHEVGKKQLPIDVFRGNPKYLYDLSPKDMHMHFEYSCVIRGSRFTFDLFKLYMYIYCI